jgi:cytochrome c-type biogenesis protein CcmH/NrfF
MRRLVLVLLVLLGAPRDSVAVDPPQAVANPLVKRALPAIIDAGDESERVDILADLWSEIFSEVAERNRGRAAVRSRRSVLEAARASLVTRLAVTLAGGGTLGGESGRAEAERLVALAQEKTRALRRQRLLDSFLCKCPEEDWTRTVAGCWQPCANEQKAWVDAWIDEGYTDDEIAERMVEAAGTDKVLVVPRSWLSSLTPYWILAGASVFVALVLVSARRRSRRAQAPESPEHSRAAAVAAGDTEIEARLEDELRRIAD